MCGRRCVWGTSFDKLRTNGGLRRRPGVNGRINQNFRLLRYPALMSRISHITTSAHAALSSRGTTSTASAELQKLVSNLHLDAIPSAGTPTASTSSTGTATGLVSGFRELFDHALDAAKTARATAKSVTSATHGAGLAGLAATAAAKIL